MAKNQRDENDKIDEEPKIFGVHIDGKNKKSFDRRDFIKAATVVGATIALTGCKNLDEDKMAEALEQTLQARENEGDSEETDKKDSEPQKPASTDTKEPTKTATEKPTQTPTNTQTSTPTEVPTDTEVPLPTGEVSTSHSLFKGPQTNHPFIKKTTVGEEVTILGKTADGIWYKIMDSVGTVGWCYSEFIKVLSNISITVISNPPTPVPTICTCDVYTPCDCDGYTAPSCSCDAHSTDVCTCDEVCTCDTVHYWYPN